MKNLTNLKVTNKKKVNIIQKLYLHINNLILGYLA